MACDPISTEGAEINLENYYLDRQFYNTYVYVHKKLRPKSELKEKQHQEAETNVNSINRDTNQKVTQNKKYRRNLHDDAIVEQTVKFAKELVPKVIPPSREFSPTPVYYTIKTSKESGKKYAKMPNNIENKKNKAKDIPKSVHREVTDSHSGRDVSHSTENTTLDDVQTNQSSTISLSDCLENNRNKFATGQRKRRHDTKEPLSISESFDAIGTNLVGEKQIKVTLMNESERNMFCEGLRLPIINSIKEHFNGVNNSTDVSSHLQHLIHIVSCNSQKIDYLAQKLDKIEKCLTENSDKAIRFIMSPKPIASKASRLEDLTEEMDVIKEENSIEDEHKVFRNLITSQSEDMSKKTSYNINSKSYRKGESLGQGEDVQHVNEPPKFGIKPDRPNRIPARFCWTDTTENS